LEDEALDAELTTVAIHASAALRRKADTLTALRKDTQATDPSARERAAGDASQAVISLYLAASAAQRYCHLTGNPSPLGRERLAGLVEVSRHLRDSVMHWHEKGRRDPDTYLLLNGRGVLARAPGKPLAQPSKASGIAWKEFESAMTMLGRWADYYRGDGRGARESKPEPDSAR
jgi:hypothetical protein